MIPMVLSEIAMVTGGEIIQGDPGVKFSAVSTDTRAARKGDLFFALSGERYDAHNFLDHAVNAGAGALVISRRVELTPEIPVLMVGDTLSALQSLASVNRARSGAFLVGVTGSTGKTTTKDMIAAVLETRFRLIKTIGNLNNEIGLPLTLLKIGKDTEVAVVEMAMRGLGEIDSLCRIARPDCAVITNINETHLELLGDISSIAAAKGEILEHIPPEGFALLNSGSPYIRREAGRCRGRVIYFGSDQAADIRAENIRTDGGSSTFNVVAGGERYTCVIPVPGRHNVLNALAAVGVGREMGLADEEIARGLAAVVLTGMRLDVINCGGLKIINDTYNASPASTKAALQTLADLAGERRKIAVLGNMLELGPRALEGHREIGETAAVLNLAGLVAVGDLAAAIYDGAIGAGFPAEKAYQCLDNSEAAGVLKKLLQAGDVVLVKGSRGMKMEQIVVQLIESWDAFKQQQKS
jgi:UDP-N-acetylmuramoyl-tripeptide--D-alanyl-D-alanine ligase